MCILADLAHGGVLPQFDEGVCFYCGAECAVDGEPGLDPRCEGPGHLGGVEAGDAFEETVLDVEGSSRTSGVIGAFEQGDVDAGPGECQGSHESG
jgi:hypothetical protein